MINQNSVKYIKNNRRHEICTAQLYLPYSTICLEFELVIKNITITQHLTSR